MLSIEELNLGVLLLSFCLWFCCNVLFVITLGLRLLKRWGFRDYPFWMLLSLATSLNTCWVYIPSVILEIPVVRKGKKKKNHWELKPEYWRSLRTSDRIWADGRRPGRIAACCGGVGPSLTWVCLVSCQGCREWDATEVAYESHAESYSGSPQVGTKKTKHFRMIDPSVIWPLSAITVHVWPFSSDVFQIYF